MFTFEWQQKAKEVPKLSENGEPIKKADGSIEMYNRPPVFSGVVKVKIPKHQERIRFLKTLNLSVNSDGEVVKRDNFDMGDKIIEFALKHIESVDLTRAEDQAKFDSVELLEYDSDGAEVLAEIGSQLMSGIKLAKTSLKK